MDHTWTRVAQHLMGRLTGPMKFRLVLQPLTAAYFGLRGGMADAKAGRSPYFWALLSTPGERVALLKSGWKDIGKVFIFAALLDVVYQMIELQFVYVGQAIIVALVLAILPYLILRGLVKRIGRRIEARRQPHDQKPLPSSR
jgi:hypothetical protein